MACDKVVAIDGPVASGKTATGSLIAQRLGYGFLDTGLMYRAITWQSLYLGVNYHDAKNLIKMSQQIAVEVIVLQDGNTSILVDGKDITQYLRDSEVEKNVSFVSQVSGVREAMVAHQRRIAHVTKLVVAGRDIGTVVFPNAPLKIFLTASVSERAHRRFEELQSGGNHIVYGTVLHGLGQRDKLDSQRKVAPLRPAPDAHIITTTGLSVKQVVEQIMRLAAEAL